MCSSDLDALTPASPDVVDYDEVINSDDPALYYRLGEPVGTKLVGHSRIIRYKKGPKKGKKKRVKRWKTRETRAPTTGISGPDGTYKNTPLLGQPGAIVGDPDTAVAFRSNVFEYAKIVLATPASSAGDGSTTGANELTDQNRLTMGCWIKVTALDASRQSIIAGPGISGGGSPVFHLHITPADRWGSWLLFTDGSNSSIVGPAVSTGVWHHVMATWNGTTHVLYLDGESVVTDTPAAGKQVRPGGTLLDDWPFFQVGRTTESGVGEFLDAVVDEVVFYEKALSATRVQSHFDAAFLGLNSATTGERIEDVLALVDSWPEWAIQAGSRTMPVTRYAGIQPIELIGEAAESEGEPALFFFNRSGVPTFLASGYRSAVPYNIPQFTFDSDGTDTPYEDLEISDEDAFHYNDIRVTTIDQYTARATDSVSIGRFGRRVLELQDMALADADADALATSLLSKYKDPFTRIISFHLNSLDADDREAMLNLEIGAQARVIWRPGNGSDLDQTSHVEGVQLEQPGLGKTIFGTFAISPR